MTELDLVQAPAASGAPIDEPLAYLAEAFGGELEPDLAFELQYPVEEAMPAFCLAGPAAVGSATSAWAVVHRC